MEKLFILLELQARAQAASSRTALLHSILNDTVKIIPYTQAVFFSPDAVGLRLERASGNATLDGQGAYAHDIKKKINAALADTSATIAVLYPEAQGCHGAIVFFRTAEEGFLGGLWLESAAAYGAAEQRILEELAAIYTQALAVWHLRGRLPWHRAAGGGGRWCRYALAGAVVLALLPVRMTMRAPAEIVARQAEVVAAPFDGMIETVNVEPGDNVKAGAVLVMMEDQSLQAQMDMAEQEIKMAQSALSRRQRESLASPEKKSNLVELQEEIASRRIARDYAADLKERGTLRAQSDGVAVFSGAWALKGKPVRAGEKIMILADPADTELQIRVPVEAMMALEKGANVSYFLNVSPFAGRKAEVRSVGYQASADADGMMTYKVMASLPDGARAGRIGWKGTARIHGAWTVLGYAIVRRPVIALRNLTGV